MSFAELGLSPLILRAVEELGYREPTPIQRQAIPVVLAGGDILAAAQTGTGCRCLRVCTRSRNAAAAQACLAPAAASHGSVGTGTCGGCFVC